MTTKRLCIFLFTMLFLITGASAETFNVKKYGARGNGKSWILLLFKRQSMPAIRLEVARYLFRLVPIFRLRLY